MSTNELGNSNVIRRIKSDVFTSRAIRRGIAENDLATIIRQFGPRCADAFYLKCNFEFFCQIHLDGVDRNARGAHKFRAEFANECSRVTAFSTLYVKATRATNCPCSRGTKIIGLRPLGKM